MKPRFLLEKMPLRIAPEEYRGCIERFVARVSKCDSVRSIYQFGGISAPGISDIDLLVVFDTVPAVNVDWPAAIHDSDRYLLMHSPVAVSTDIFSHCAYLAAVKSAHLVWGRECSSVAPTKSANEFLVRVIAAEQVVRLFINSQKQLHLRRLKVRPALCELSSLRYDLELVPEFTHPAKEEFVGAITDLRHRWFELSDECRIQSLVGVLTTGVVLMRALLNFLNNWAQNLTAHPVESGQKAVCSRWRSVLMAREQTGDATLRHCMGRPAAWLGSVLAKVPIPSSRELGWRLGRHELRIGSGLFDLLLGNAANFSEEAASVLDLRNALIKEYLAFLSAVGAQWGSVWSGVFEANVYARPDRR